MLENGSPIRTADIDEFFKHLNQALEEGEQYFAQFKDFKTRHLQ
jgi:hypothetical protein